jgi:hypothetical protein
MKIQQEPNLIGMLGKYDNSKYIAIFKELEYDGKNLE